MPWTCSCRLEFAGVSRGGAVAVRVALRGRDCADHLVIGVVRVDRPIGRDGGIGRRVVDAFDRHGGVIEARRVARERSEGGAREADRFRPAVVERV
eukprot:6675135-Prymnesium_polylepis.1